MANMLTSFYQWMMSATLVMMLASVFVLIIRSHIYYAYSFINTGLKRAFVLVTRFALGLIGLVAFHDLVNYLTDPSYLGVKEKVFYAAVTIILLFRAVVFKVEQATVDKAVKEVVKTQTAPTKSVVATYASVIALTALSFYVGPIVENKVNPILVNQRITQVERVDDSTICWTWSYYKTRNAKLVDYNVYAYDGRGRRLYVNVTRRDGSSVILSNTMPRRQSISVDLCATNLPKADEPIHVTGYITYRAYHGMWKIEQELQAFTYGKPVSDPLAGRDFQ